MPTDNDLPLSGNIQSLNIWLNSLNQLGSHRASNKLYDMLQMVYQETFDTQTKLELLNELVMPVISYSDKLENIVIAQQCFKSEVLVRKTTTLSCELLRLLSLNFCKISLAEELNPEQHTLVLFSALYLIGLSMCKRAALNQFPSETLWKKTAEIYQRAQKYHLLDQPVSLTSAFTSPQNSIAEVLQRNLLFMVCDPYHFNYNTLKEVFLFAENYSALLKMDVPAEDADFAWGYKQQNTPHPNIKSAKPLAQNLYFSCQAITDLLALQNPLNFSKADLDHLRHHLSGYAAIIDSAIPSEASSCKFLVDYQHIHAFINHYATIQNIHRASTPSGTAMARSSALQLVPLNAPTQPKHSTILLNPDDPFATPPVSVHPTRYKNYYLTTTANPALEIGLPILLVDKSEHLRLGLIRQITTHPVTKSQQVLIELITGSVESVTITLDEQTTLAVLITQSTNEKEILIPDAKVQSGMQFSINSRTTQGDFFLGELLQFTAYCRHYKISSD